MASQERITVHNLADLKNTSDDAIPNYLNSLKFKQDHTLMDTRLALGYASFAVAGACFFWDYKFGFEDTKFYTAIAVALYAVLSGALTLWITFVEKGTVYRGTSKDGTKVHISTHVKKNVPMYYVTVLVTPKGWTKPKTEIEWMREFYHWFDEQGHFVPLPFQAMFARLVPPITALDPQRADLDPRPDDAPLPSSLLALDTATLDALAATEASGAQTAAAEASGAETNVSGGDEKAKRRKA
ncbi:microsomal signal peptidase 25 kDa subunit-domain-containing protein [Xylaria sp. CBS 124048]|nr:microsomal signal peptidase 25 kDa subunit-domain-containing protein [Xylaria sp. CBS 124048]